VPVGYLWHREIGPGFDPDLRLQEAPRIPDIDERALIRSRQSIAELPRISYSIEEIQRVNMLYITMLMRG
jgi:hypothetical protein